MRDYRDLLFTDRDKTAYFETTNTFGKEIKVPKTRLLKEILFQGHILLMANTLLPQDKTISALIDMVSRRDNLHKDLVEFGLNEIVNNYHFIKITSAKDGLFKFTWKLRFVQWGKLFPVIVYDFLTKKER